MVHSFTIFAIIFSLNLWVNISLSFLSEGSTRVAGTFRLENAFMARSTADTSDPLRRIFKYSQQGIRICCCKYFVGAKKRKPNWPVSSLFYTLSAGKLVCNRVTGWNYRLALGWGWRVLQFDSCGAKEWGTDRVGQRQRQEKISQRTVKGWRERAGVWGRRRNRWFFFFNPFADRKFRRAMLQIFIYLFLHTLHKIKAGCCSNNRSLL